MLIGDTVADKLSVTITFVKDHYEVTAEMEEVDVLPSAIFLYENTGDTSLGEYYGVANLDELLARQEWTGVAIPTFGNRWVRYTEALVIAPNEEEAEKSKAWIIENVQRLKQQILTQSPDTEVIII